MDVPSMYVPGQQLMVTLKRADGKSTFKGFMLQARRVDTMERVGQFMVIGGTKQNCLTTGGKALSHDSGSDKSNLSITWTAPSPGVGDIKFLFTIVKVKSQFWVNQTSSVIHQSGVPIPIDTSQCGQTVGCYRQPDNCTTDCDVMVTWRKDGSKYVNFVMDGKVPDPNYYIALGFSNDDKMGDDSVIDCLNYNTQSGVQMSYNNGRHNEVLFQKTFGLVASKSEVAYYNGRLRCQFTRYISVSNIPNATSPGSTVSGSSDSYRAFNLNPPYVLFIAKGPVGDSGVKMKHTDDPVISVTPVRVVGVYDVGSVSKSSNLITVHGVMMILAWMCSASIAVLMPRYYKKTWPGRECVGKPLWFQIHQPLMILSFLLTIIAFIIIFVSVGGYANYPDYPQKAHPPLGIVVTCLIVINPIMAAFRPHPGATKRPIFNKLHFLVGEAAHICSAAAIFISLYINKVGAPSWAKWIMVSYIVWEILVEVILQVYNCTRKRATHEKYEMNAVTNPDDNEARQPDSESSSFKTFIIVIHVLIVIGLGIALIVAIA